MKSFLNKLRTLIGPRPVSAILADANAVVVELKQTSKAQAENCVRYQALANHAASEADRAQRVADKLSALLS